jgi:putative AlgH/UPF0301 family transcriptional regulator
MKYKNKLLIATDKVSDIILQNKAVHIFTNSRAGSEGVILNPVSVGTIYFNLKTQEYLVSYGNYGFSFLNYEAFPLYFGGNSKTGVYFIHGYPDCPVKEQLLNVWDSSSFHNLQLNKMKIVDGVHFGDPHSLNYIIGSNPENNKFRFYTGQVYWGANKLEEEIDAGLWEVHETQAELFFDLGLVDDKIKMVDTLYKLFVSPTKDFDPTWN